MGCTFHLRKVLGAGKIMDEIPLIIILLPVRVLTKKVYTTKGNIHPLFLLATPLVLVLNKCHKNWFLKSVGEIAQ